MSRKVDLFDSLKNICERRRSVRDFSTKKVSPHDIEKIKEIAYTSPYASSRKNWELIIVTEKDKIEELASLVRIASNELKKKIRDDLRGSFIKYTENFIRFEKAPILVIPTFRITPTMSFMMKDIDSIIAQWERDNYVKSISCVAMLVLLAAESLGLGGCYMTGPLIAEDEIAKAINVKKGRNIGAVIPIGYPK